MYKLSFVQYVQINLVHVYYNICDHIQEAYKLQVRLPSQNGV